MPRLSDKHGLGSIRVLELGNFDGGLRTAVSSEGLEENEMASCINFEFDSETKGLKTVDGFRTLYEAPVQIKSMDWDLKRFQMLYQGEDNHLYVTGLIGQTDLGLLSGTDSAMFQRFRNEKYDIMLVASGGKLQYYDGTGLKTIDNSFACNIVLERMGRIIIASTSNNFLYYSGMYDVMTWPTIGTPGADNVGKYLEVAHGKIVAIQQLAADLVVFMDDGNVYSVRNEYPDWQVIKLTTDGYCLNRFCAVSALNDLFFNGTLGFSSLKTVVEYGDIKRFETGNKINSSLNVYGGDQTRMWYLPYKGQLWIKPRQDGFVYMFHLHNQAFTTREFMSYTGNVFNDLKAVVSVEKKVYVALGNKIALLDDSSTTQDDRPIESSLRSKLFVSHYDYQIKCVEIGAYNIAAGEGVLMVGELPIPLKFMAGGPDIVDDVDKDAAGVAIPSDGVTHTIYDIAIDTDYSSANEALYHQVIADAYAGPDYRDIVVHDPALEGDYHDIWEMPTTVIKKRCNYRTHGADVALILKTGGFSLRYIRIYYTEV